MEVGFFGKLPSHGDFLRRRVSDAFVNVWDSWLQDCLATSRDRLGDRWLDIYLTSPAWRFACAPGVFGPAPAVGLLVPSVDRVGRYFHLTLVAQLTPDVRVVRAATGLTSFYERAEELVIQTLESDNIDFERFDAFVATLGNELEALDGAPRAPLDKSKSSSIVEEIQSRWQIPLDSASDLSSVLLDVMADTLAERYDPLVMFWTDGSANVEPTCLIGKGLPSPEAFGALLDGLWTEHEWRSVGVASAHGDTTERLVNTGVVRFRSAGASDVGCVRKVNQDSRLERTEVRLWAVADGMGGHSEGEVASRMVCDALADFMPEGDLDQMIALTDARLHEVNDYLVRRATRPTHAVVSGSTVVVLLAREAEYAVLWAGDSRVYRWRAGRLEQLTRDHSLAAETQGLTSVASNVVTRAIGGDANLTMDVVRERILAGDRFLLCSDGLTKFVPETQIEQWVAHPDLQQAVDGLIDATLVAGAPDNVTAVIVEAF